MAKKTLYVGNLPYSISSEALEAHFQPYGGSNPRIIEGRGFGFIDVEADSAATAIADKHNGDLDGRTIVVNEARPKEDRGGGGYSSGGGNRSRGNRY